ncbi:MAG: SOS response-associated peptidase [Firmicutes bacterium HGW-Firmicutes-1]|jgi:putative SOS response-associated peptidase YedK|nr:MAG: SOS response-associated peptidase [Firmicutes bacterium HGW-Firmicutes-1]
MCGRYVLFSEKENREIMKIINEIDKRFGSKANIKTGEVFPTDAAPVLITGDQKLLPTIMNWGFPNFQNKGVIINARSETAIERPTFREALLTRRCVIPSTGFYEWTHPQGKKHKDKYLFTLPGMQMLYMAGLYSTFKIDGQFVSRFVILTTEANASMCEIHNRMPIVLQRNHLEAWVKNTDIALEILQAKSPELERIVV